MFQITACNYAVNYKPLTVFMPIFLTIIMFACIAMPNHNYHIASYTILLIFFHFLDEEGNNGLFETRFARIFMIILLCLIVYAVDVRRRHLQTEQYAWPKILNRMTVADTEKSPSMPWTFKVPDFYEKLENNETWSSPSFIVVLKYKYITWLSVKFVKDKGITVTFFFKKTDIFTWEWPQDTMFTLELLNQQHDNNHYFMPFLIDIKECYYVNDVTMRCTTGFVSTAFLDKTTPNQYFRNGNAYLRVSHDNSLYSYMDWFMRQYLKLTISNISIEMRLIWLICILLIFECQLVCNTVVRNYVGYFNETLLQIFEALITATLFYTLFIYIYLQV